MPALFKPTSFPCTAWRLLRFRREWGPVVERVEVYGTTLLGGMMLTNRGRVYASDLYADPREIPQRSGQEKGGME